MKKCLLILVGLFCFQISNAQISKGTRLLEGTLSFYNQKSEDQFAINGFPAFDELSNIDFKFNPRIAFFTAENFAFGIGVNYEFNKAEIKRSLNGDPQILMEQKSNLYLLNPFVRKFINLNDNIYFTVTANLQVGFGKVKYEGDGSADSNLFAFRGNITPGVTLMLSDKWAATVNVGQLFYEYKKETLDIDLDPKPENVDNNIGITFQLSTIQCGIQYFIR